MTIRTKLLISPALLILTVTLVIVLSYQEVSRITRALDREIETAGTVTKGVYQDTILTLMSLLESISMDPMLGPEPAELNHILFNLRKYKAVTSAFFLDENEAVLADGETLDRIPLLGKPLPEKFRIPEKSDHPVFTIIGENLIYSKSLTDQGDKIGRLQVTFSLEAIESITSDLSGHLRQSVAETRHRGLMIIIGSTLLILIASLLTIFITRSITAPIRTIIKGMVQGAAYVADASKQVAEMSQGLAKGVSEQSGILKESSKWLEKMAVLVGKTSDLTLGTEQMMKLNLKKSGWSLKSIVELTQIMGQIEADSSQIGQIIKTIDGIAFQTNLLSLNAAVEAARAGEAGTGFGVVAEEVRHLATRSAESAKNTQQLLDGTIQKVSLSVSALRDINANFDGIVKTASVMGEKSAAITRAVKEQAKDISKISKDTIGLNNVTEQFSSSIQEYAAMAEELSAHADVMQDFVRKLNTLLEGKKGRTSLSLASRRMIPQKGPLVGHAASDEDSKRAGNLAMPSHRFCKSLPKCPFFNEKMANMPSSAKHYKEKYCMGNNADCARYMVSEKLGKNKVPPDLFPNQKDRAQRIIQKHQP